MRIAAKLAGAALGVLMLSPVAAQAATSPFEPPPSETRAFSAPQKAGVAAGLEFAEEMDDAERLRLKRLKKRKKPQFQTRFFGE